MQLSKMVVLTAAGACLGFTQPSSSKLVLIPTESMADMNVPAPVLKSVPKSKEIVPDTSPIRPAILNLKPAGDPIYLEEEPGQDADAKWRTYKRPKVDLFSRDGNGAALQGYDVVSYQEAKPVMGTQDIASEFGGVVWRFATEEHRSMFEQDPQRYVPQFGGFCAYSVSKGYAATANPRVYSIEGGKLTLFFDGAVKTVWEQDRSSIQKATRNWTLLHR